MIEFVAAAVVVVAVAAAVVVADAAAGATDASAVGTGVDAGVEDQRHGPFVGPRTQGRLPRHRPPGRDR